MKAYIVEMILNLIGDLLGAGVGPEVVRTAEAFRDALERDRGPGRSG